MQRGGAGLDVIIDSVEFAKWLAREGVVVWKNDGGSYEGGILRHASGEDFWFAEECVNMTYVSRASFDELKGWARVYF